MVRLLGLLPVLVPCLSVLLRGLFASFRRSAVLPSSYSPTHKRIYLKGSYDLENKKGEAIWYGTNLGLPQTSGVTAGWQHRGREEGPEGGLCGGKRERIRR